VVKVGVFGPDCKVHNPVAGSVGLFPARVVLVVPVARH